MQPRQFKLCFSAQFRFVLDQLSRFRRFFRRISNENGRIYKTSLPAIREQNEYSCGQVPQAVCLMINNLMTSRTPWQQIDIRLAATVSNVLVIINSSSNFVLYSSLSTKFRRTFRQLFCARCYGSASPCNGELPTAAGTGAPCSQVRNRTRNDYRLVGSRQTTQF